MIYTHRSVCWLRAYFSCSFFWCSLPFALASVFVGSQRYSQLQIPQMLRMCLVILWRLVLAWLIEDFCDLTHLSCWILYTLYSCWITDCFFFFLPKFQPVCTEGVLVCSRLPHIHWNRFFYFHGFSSLHSYFCFTHIIRCVKPNRSMYFYTLFLFLYVLHVTIVDLIASKRPTLSRAPKHPCRHTTDHRIHCCCSYHKAALSL